jgi:hypothetical protein
VRIAPVEQTAQGTSFAGVSVDDIRLKAGNGLRHLPHRAHISLRIYFARSEPGLENGFARKVSPEVIGHLLPASMKYRKDRFVP